VTEVEYAELARQHVALLSSLAQLWTIFVVLVLLGLAFLVCMFLLAAWSVNRVNKRQIDLEGKFTLLIDVLLQSEANRRGSS